MPKDYDGAERRRAARYETRGELPGLLKLDLRTEVLTLSAGGMLCELELPLSPGSEHRFSLTLDDDALDLKGIVRNCSPLLNGEEPPSYRLGVQFLELTDRELQVLNRFVEKRSQA